MKKIGLLISIFFVLGLCLSPALGYAEGFIIHEGYPELDIQAEPGNIEFNNQDEELNKMRNNSYIQNALACSSQYDPEEEACEFERCKCEFVANEAYGPDSYRVCTIKYSTCIEQAADRNVIDNMRL